jgi:hypothetical protein
VFLVTVFSLQEEK